MLPLAYVSGFGSVSLPQLPPLVAWRRPLDQSLDVSGHLTIQAHFLF
jgi:hypothetical protein